MSAADPATSDAAVKPSWRRRFLKKSLRIAIGVGLLALILFLIVAQPVLPSARSDGMDASPDRLKGHVTAICSNFYPRHCFNRPNLDRCADYISDALNGPCTNVSFQEYEISGDTYRNVRAIFGDTKAERIIVVAHYDACDNTPGADDNASGIAGLIELAHLLEASAISNAVELVAVCTEEPPHFATEDMGSAHHAQLLEDEGVPVKAAIALEMIGFFNDESFSQTYPVPLLYSFYPNRGNFICIASDLGNASLTRRVKKSMRSVTDLGVHSINAPRRLPGIDFSDHRSYWDKDIPAVMITDSAFYRNKRYHSLDDSPDTLDYERMAEVVSAVHMAVLHLDSQ